MESDSQCDPLFPVKGKVRLCVVRGKGSFLYSDFGQKILDLYTGHGVALLGHGHPAYIRGLKSQISRLVFASTLAEFPDREKAARVLLDSCGADFCRVFFVNSGAEANEVAFKIARKATGKQGIVAFEGGFHGRTWAALSACGLPAYRGRWNLDPSVQVLPWDNPAVLESLDFSRMAAIILEPIQGLAGIRTASRAFYETVTRVSREHGAVLISDEVQAGLGRTGKFASSEHFGLSPGIITLAKGLANGLPAGAVVVHRDLEGTLEPGDHGNTFGGGPLVMKAVLLTLEAIHSRNLMAKADTLGRYLGKQLAAVPSVEEVRGKGLFIGFRTPFKGVAVRDALLEKGAWVGLSEDPAVLRLLPPLTLKRAEAKWFVACLRETLEDLQRKEAPGQAVAPPAGTSIGAAR